MSFWSIVKFYLGLPCVAKFGDKYVITKREGGFLRVCLSRTSEFWWLSSWNRYCAYDTLEQAQARFDVIIGPSKPIKLKLKPLEAA